MAKQLTPWASTARRYAAKSRVVLLAQDPSEYEGLAVRYGIEVIGSSLTMPRNEAQEAARPDPVYVFKSRWRAIADFLALDLAPADEDVLLTDTRDVIFQRFPLLHEPDGRVLVATEGIMFRHEAWNRERLLHYFPDEAEALLDQAVICAGVLQAPKAVLAALAMTVWAKLRGKPGEADQMALNLVLRSGTYAMEVVPYTQAWCCHCAQMLAGSTILRRNVPLRSEQPPKLKGMQVVEPALHIPFAIVHQWTIVPALRLYGEES